MIKARHIRFFVHFFNFYTHFQINRKFERVIINGQVKDKGLPVLIIGNHISWWDGFWTNWLNLKLFRRKFHVMMLEDQLRPRMFLNRAGAFSVRKNHRSVMDSIAYCAEILRNPKNLLLLYPQGEIQSIYQERIIFKKGLERILNNVTYSFQFIFFAVLVDYFSRPKPSLFFYIKEHKYNKGDSLISIEEAYNIFLQESMNIQKGFTS